MGASLFGVWWQAHQAVGVAGRLETPLEPDDGVEATHEVPTLAILIAFIKARSVLTCGGAAGQGSTVPYGVLR
jgi:hypothetical protein